MLTLIYDFEMVEVVILVSHHLIKTNLVMVMN